VPLVAVTARKFLNKKVNKYTALEEKEGGDTPPILRTHITWLEHHPSSGKHKSESSGAFGESAIRSAVDRLQRV
jgi:hypothetical protein